MARPSRRQALATGAAAFGLATWPRSPVRAQSAPRVVVVGGGFGGATAARYLAHASPRIDVTLVEANTRFTACPFSNLVISGMREIGAQLFAYDRLREVGVRLVFNTVTQIDAAKRRVTLADGAALEFDRLVLAPGVDMRWGALPGYDEAASKIMPHAWKAGAQTVLLRRQLEAMDDGSTVIMAVPDNPYRCPPGPYERASLIAHYLKTHKPRSKLIVLDAKDAFSKQRLFTQAWKALYPLHLEWVGLSVGGRVTRVEAASKTLITDFGQHKASVANVIPPQQASDIAIKAGVADATGWCPIDPVSFESRRIAGIHIIGDAALAGAMPKSAFSANAQAKVAAAAIADILAGRSPRKPKLINTCYSLVAPDYGISVAGVYEPSGGVLREVKGSGGSSPVEAPQQIRS
ncbi:MAG: NAD(P)/FAD-dependent oxidoreductase, partial [Hyphomicrobiaceae bacterium]